MICISIGDAALIGEVNSLNPSLVEIRYDLIGMEPEQLSELLNNNILQVATCRPGKHSELERLSILKRAMDMGSAYVDIEIESPKDFIQSISSYARESNSALIVSYHNFDTTPSYTELINILSSCYDLGADIAKISCYVKSIKDSARLLSLYAEEGRKVVIGMGDEGKITRLAALELGAEFSFAAISEKFVTAPGQLSYAEMQMFKNLIDG